MGYVDEMANIPRGEAECYISIEAKCQVLYFTYSTVFAFDPPTQNSLLSSYRMVTQFRGWVISLQTIVNASSSCLLDTLTGP